MLEQRVAQLEEDVKEMKSTLKSVETIVLEIRAELKHIFKAADYASLRAEIAEVKGRVANLPTTWQMMVRLITTWSAGTAIVFSLLRFAR